MEDELEKWKHQEKNPVVWWYNIYIYYNKIAQPYQSMVLLGLLYAYASEIKHLSSNLKEASKCVLRIQNKNLVVNIGDSEFVNLVVRWREQDTICEELSNTTGLWEMYHYKPMSHAF